MTWTLSIFLPFFLYSDQTIESYVNNYIPFNVWLLVQCPFFSISFPTSANAKLATFALVVVDILGSPYERDWHWYLRGAYSYSDSNPKTTRLQKPSFHGLHLTTPRRSLFGEAGVPFFSISASEFVEIFAGIGASRVRDLFEQVV